MSLGDNIVPPLRASQAGRSPGLKLLVIALLTLALAVPLFLVQWALSDRQSTAAGAADDIAQGYGGPQIVTGPLLVVPYSVAHVEVLDGKTLTSQQHFSAVILPENLKLQVKADTETRARGIFAVPVYRANVDLHAQFDKASIASAFPADAQIDWANAILTIAVSDTRGLADNVVLNVNGRMIAFEPGAAVGAAGMQARVSLNAASDLSLATQFVLRGSREISLAPLGKRTVAAIQSPWGSPSFFGAFLPSERQVSGDGFTASWTVPYLARGFGQSFANRNDAIQAITPQAFGVRFYQPVDHYQLVARALKYAILFVALAFLVFFVAETISGRRIHVVQYALVGAAQVLFYLLLLSIAEHTGFAIAYGVAASATVILTGLYAITAFGHWGRAAVTTAVLAALYVMLYVILNSEDNALLTGACVLFAALAGTMYFTRKIDWYRAAENPSA